MSIPLLTTKLYSPPSRPKTVLRPRLMNQLNEGNHRTLTLISAPAGFGKTTLVSEWLTLSGHPAAWLSLDEDDNDPLRFLTYFIAALQTVVPTLGTGISQALQSPQPPSPETLLTLLLNEITALSDSFFLVLDDYHLIDAAPIHHMLLFLLNHLPARLHVVLTTREDPPFPLARWRVRNQLTELREADLRFTHTESAEFLQRVMGLTLSSENIAHLETRTEGWIAGLQLAALSMQGLQDPTPFIDSFTGSHHFVLDYLMQEVLQQQSEPIQTFLLQTSILDRFCAPLCDAVLLNPAIPGHTTLETIEQANLFMVPLDKERRWYRYHHLFADLLRQRLHQKMNVSELHHRAAQWYEANALEFEAFHHAVAAHDIEHAERLVEGNGMPLHFRGAAIPVLNWLQSLPPSILNANPSLWVIYASALLFKSQISGVEAKLQAAETALSTQPLNDKHKDLIGHIAAIRATIAVSQHDVESIFAQARRALEYLHPENLPVRTATTWALGYAYHLQGDRIAATRAYTEAFATSEALGHIIIMVMTKIGLGNMQEGNTHLYDAAKSYQQVLDIVENSPFPIVCEAHLGLARIFYQWNDFAAARHHASHSIQLARQLDQTDRIVASEIFDARLQESQGSFFDAAAILSRIERLARQQGFIHRLPEIAMAQVEMFLRQGDIEKATLVAQTQALPISLARVYIAQGNPEAALMVLESLRAEMEAKQWVEEQLKVMILQTVATYIQGETSAALERLKEVLIIAEPAGYLRLFVDEGLPMTHLLTEALANGIMPEYIGRILQTLKAEGKEGRQLDAPSQPLIEPLSQRELEVLQLISQGFSNHEIGEQLFLALNTVKGHNQRIFGKLQVQRRTEAVARARETGLL